MPWIGCKQTCGAAQAARHTDASYVEAAQDNCARSMRGVQAWPRGHHLEMSRQPYQAGRSDRWLKCPCAVIEITQRPSADADRPKSAKTQGDLGLVAHEEWPRVLHVRPPSRRGGT